MGEGISKALDTKICHLDACIMATTLNLRSQLNVRQSQAPNLPVDMDTEISEFLSSMPPAAAINKKKNREKNGVPHKCIDFDIGNTFSHM